MPSRIPPDRQHSTFTSAAVLPNPPTSFIGRDQETAELTSLLTRSETRLLTLTGPGGVGKSRLAISVAKAIEGRDQRQVIFIPLASVRDAALVPSTIGAAFGVSDSGEEALAGKLGMILQDQSILLVLDNFEHVVNAAPFARSLIDACPTLTILVTSRRLLRVSGEVERRVSPLETPRSEDSDQEVFQSAAYQLFVERSAGNTVDSNQVVRSADIAAIGRICRRLDGLPLAIELAAARTKVLTPDELLARLDRRFSLLTDGPVDAPTRLRRLRDAIAWSYDLLSEDEQRLFRTLAAFSGGFTLSAVEAVVTDDLAGGALDLLARLFDHSLVIRMPANEGPARFTMLETIREFALEALVAEGEEESARDRHLRFFAGQCGPQLPGWWFEPRGRRDAHSPLGDHDNLRAALSWSFKCDQPEFASQIASGLMEFWWRNGLNVEAALALGRILENPVSLDPVTVAGITIRLAFFEYVCGNFARARDRAQESLQLCQELGYDLGTSAAIYCLGHVSQWSDGGASIQYFEEALRIARSIKDLILVDSILIQLGSTHMAIGNYELARDFNKEAIANLLDRKDAPDALAMAQAGLAWVEGLLGNWSEAEKLANDAIFTNQDQHYYVEHFINALRVRGNVALARSQFAAAAEILKEALQLSHWSSISHLEGSVLVGLAKIAALQGDWQRSAKLFGFLHALWEKLEFSQVARRMISGWDDGYELSAARMADAEVCQAFEAGRHLSHAEVYAEAMGVTVTVTSAAREEGHLTRREAEVLAHLAQGKTNQEIAADLFLGKSTVDTHVSHILSKLGVDSRRDAVRVARERALLPE